MDFVMYDLDTCRVATLLHLEPCCEHLPAFRYLNNLRIPYHLPCLFYLYYACNYIVPRTVYVLPS